MLALRPLCLFLSASTICTAGAQLSPPEQLIQESLMTLGANSAAVFELKGIRQLNGNSHTVDTNVYWSSELSGAKIVNKVEISQWVDGAQFATVIGDGTTLWTYDFEKNRYSAFTYGSYAEVVEINDTRPLLNALDALSTGQSAYATQLLRQTFSTSGVGYTSWMPGNAATESGSPTLKVVGYAPTPVDNKKIDFTIETGGGPATLDSVAFDQTVLQGGLSRRLAWTLKVFPGRSLVAPSGFKFVPPPCSLPVSGSLRKID